MSIYSKNERNKQFLKWFIMKYEPKCYFCNETISEDSFHRNKHGEKDDGLSIHHIDENRDNNKPENLAVAHRKCHLKHHRQKEIAIYNEQWRNEETVCVVQ